MTLTIRKRKMIYKLKRWNGLCIIPTSQLTTRVPELYENLSPTQKLKLNFPIRTILMQFHLKTNKTNRNVSWRRFTHAIFPPNHQPFQATFIPKNHTQSALAQVKCRPKRFFGRKRLGVPFSPNEPEDVWEESLGGDNQC